MKFRIIFFQLICILGICCTNTSDCGKYINENYNDADSNLPDSIHLQIEGFLEKLNEPSIHDLKFEAYRLFTSYSLSNTYNSFLFQDQGSNFELIFKEYVYDSESGKAIIKEETKKMLTKSQWEHLQYLIYKFKFWTETEMKVREVADGSSYILEGHRPQAKKCSKKVDKITLRGSPNESDNIGWLCDELISLYVHVE